MSAPEGNLNVSGDEVEEQALSVLFYSDERKNNSILFKKYL
jgi:hypothetical protein